MFPTQYPTKNIAETVVFLVYPAVLLAMRLKHRGKPPAKPAASQRPPRRESFIDVGSSLTIIIPTSDTKFKKAIIIHLDFGTFAAIKVPARTYRIWKAADDMPSRSV
jgi:hypothetical protein